MVTSRSALVTEEEFLSLPETLDKIELIDGEVFLAPAPNPAHQLLLGELFALLRDWARTRDATVLPAPLDIRFGPDRILQPDVAVFLEPLDLKKSPVTRIPTLCIEILSASNRGHDRITKRYVYGEAGVREYWVVDPQGRVDRFSGDRLSEAAVFESTLESPLLPGFALPLAQLYAAVAQRLPAPE